MSDRARHPVTDPFDTRPMGGVLKIIGCIGLACALAAIGVVVYMHFFPAQPWPTVPGSVIAVRAVPTVLDRQSVYKGQVLVQYKVADQEYTFWADATVAATSEQAQRDADRQYDVAYNPTNPKQARIIRPRE